MTQPVPPDSSATAPLLTSAYLPIDRQHALASRQPLPELSHGSALFADISGFTQLSEALKLALGARRGSEILADHLNTVYDALIAEVDAYGGSVISFSGDAITCWFDAKQPLQAGQPPFSPALRAVACALAMQESLCQVQSFEIPGQGQVQLRMKVSVASGQVHRFVVGNPQIQVIDVIAGKVMERMAAAEHLASRDEVVVDSATAELLGTQAVLGDWRTSSGSPERYVLIQSLHIMPPRHAWETLSPETLREANIRPYLLPPVYQRLHSDLGEFLTELRPTVALFLRFGGIDYDQDHAAGQKLDSYVRWVQHVVQRYDGTLLHLGIGDKGSYIYISFGSPVVHENDSLRAVSTALELRESPPELSYINSVQIGINQGTMRAGAYGSHNRRTYGVIGDDTNLAARLMQAAAPGEILVSEPVRKAAGSAVEWLARNPIQVKGKSEPIEVAVPLNLIQVQIEGSLFTGELIGRQVELKHMLDFLNPMLNPAPAVSGSSPARFAGVLYLLGEAGVGKSRLVYELRRQLGALPMPETRSPARLQWFECPTEPILRQSLHPFKNFLHRYFSQSTDHSENENKLYFDQAIDHLLTSLEAAAENDMRCALLRNQLDRTRSMLGAQVDLFWPGSLYELLEPKLRFENTLQAIKALILAESLQQPVLLHLEDAHWLDADSLALLKVLVSNISGYPLAILFSMRPLENNESATGEAGETYVRIDAAIRQETIELDRLNADISRQLAAQALAGENASPQPISDELAAFLLEKSDGNPLFLENLAIELRARNLVRLEKERWILISKGLEEVPATLNALLIAQLDRLEDRVRATVQTASVLGNEFEVPVLQSMTPAEKRLQTLVQQARKRLIWMPASELQYLFRHSLLRDAAYAMQPAQRLQELHARAATSIENLHHLDLAPYYADLAHHYDLAHSPVLAFHFARLAGERSAAQYANQQAIEHFQHALRCAALLEADLTICERLFIHLALGELLVTTGQHQLAQEHLLQALALAEKCNDVDSQARACRWLANQNEIRSEYSHALEWVQRGLDILGERQTAESSELLNTAGLIYSRQGDYTNASKNAESCMQIAKYLNLPKTQARAHNLLGQIMTWKGESSAAVEHFHQALFLYQQVGDINGQAMAQNQLASALFYLGRLTEAAQYFSLARQSFEQINDIYHRSFTDNNLGYIAISQGRLDAALEYFQQGLIATEQLGGSPWMLGGFHTGLGAAYIRLGNPQAAQYHLEISASYYQKAKARDWLPELNHRLASTALLAGNFDEAQNKAELAFSLAQELKMPVEGGVAQRVLGEIALAQEQFTLALEHLHRSLEILGEVGEAYEQARSQLVMAQVYARLDDQAAMQQAIAECLPVFERLDARLDLQTARQLMI